MGLSRGLSPGFLKDIPLEYYCPSELPYATRWIARTKDEDALGMCLPATAEHKGRTYCRAHGQQRYLAPGQSVSFHVETGIVAG